VFLADQAWSIARVTGERATTLNSRNFGELIGALQGMLSDRLVLSVSNLFERPSGRHPCHSIPALLDKLRELAPDLEVRERRRVLRWLSGNISGTTAVSDQDITEELVRILEGRLPNASDVEARLSRALRAVKARRDKFITHSEVLSAESLPPVTWEDPNLLVRFAKEVLSLIGWAYLSIAYAPEIGHADHFLTRDAEGQAVALRRLLSAAAIEPTSQPPLGDPAEQRRTTDPRTCVHLVGLDARHQENR